MFAYNWSSEEHALDDKALLAGAVDWQEAACRDGSGTLTELFFSDELADIALAKAICSGCAMAEPCLEGALARREPAGVWGGQLFVEGEVVAFKRKRGRPPKNPPAGIGAPGVQGQERKSA
jgi:WhiB family redox-sensing transcriptional regulator